MSVEFFGIIPAIVETDCGTALGATSPCNRTSCDVVTLNMGLWDLAVLGLLIYAAARLDKACRLLTVIAARLTADEDE